MSQDLDRDLFSLLHDVARLVRVEADKRAREYGMTRAQWSLVLRLERNPGLSQKELADMLEVEPISVARLVDRLEANGLVERRADANDRRIWRLHLMPAAAPVVKKIAVLRADLASFIARDIPQPLRDAMAQCLTQMKINLSQPAGPPGEAAAPMQEIA